MAESALDHHQLLEVALQEARAGLLEGGIPIGAALFDRSGRLLGKGRNRRIQADDPSAHAEVEAFRNAGRQRSYRDKIMVTTLAPCWYCSGLIRQFRIGTVLIGESQNFSGGMPWLLESEISSVVLDSVDCAVLLGSYIAAHPDIWSEDIGDCVHHHARTSSAAFRRAYDA